MSYKIVPFRAILLDKMFKDREAAMLKKKSLKKVISIIFISSILFGCSNDQTKLEKVKGNSFTYSEYFHEYDGLDEREKIQYYKPLSLNEV